MKILFDNSVHLGQFCINNERVRISAKNSQIIISSKPNTECVGVESFNENAFSDDIIWGIPREPQDVFYKFMDVYHSLKNVDRVPLNNEDSENALKISKDLGINISNALTCAIAIRTKANEVHSFYSEFKKGNVVHFLSTHGIVVNNPTSEKENSFSEDNLETYYKDSFACFKKCEIDLVSKFHI